VALDDQYANKFAPLFSTTIYPKPGHQLLYTPMTGRMKCPSVTTQKIPENKNHNYKFFLKITNVWVGVM
jgi:hypothetical protein